MTTPTPSATATGRAPQVEQAEAARLFSLSIVISGTRCVLTYIVFPWVLPLLGIAGGVGPTVGLGVGLVAILFNILSIRRWRNSGHAWRVPLMTLNGCVIALLVVLVAVDTASLLT